MSEMDKPTGNGIIVFAGTHEGRSLYEFCVDRGIRAIFCVATPYGRQMLSEARSSSQDIRAGRMDEAEMLALFQREKPVMIIDATHPYAVEVTENIQKAAEEYRRSLQIEAKVYYRVLRSLSEPHNGLQKPMHQEEEPEARDYGDNGDMGKPAGGSAGDPAGGSSSRDRTDILYCTDMRQAAAYLDTVAGNVLVTTGSKQLDELCKLQNYADRVYLRILPNPDILQECLDRGFRPDHMICMQGPFSVEMNVAMLQEYNICYLLTKQSGTTGGYPQKVISAGQCGAKLVVVTPPQEAAGVSVEEMKEIVAGLE